MTPAIILSIIDSSLKIYLLSLESATPEQRAEITSRHLANMARWEKVLDKLKFWDND
jgi:hypothetical protein